MYKLAGEDEKAYRIAHPDGRTFAVAKKGLGKAIHAKIKALAPVQSFPDGGLVKKEEEKPEEPAKEKTWAEMRAEMDAASQARPPLGPREAYPTLGRLIGGTLGESLATPPAAPVEATPSPAGNLVEQPGMGGGPMAPLQRLATGAQPPQQTTAMGMSFPGDPYGALIKETRQGTAAEQEAIKAQAQAEGELATKQAAIQQEAVNFQNAHAQTMKDNFDAFTKEHDAQVRDIQNFHIDPHRMWTQPGAPSKVQAVIGILLSGIGSGLTGKDNMAMQVIQNQIAQDIDAQKMELGKKENLLSDAYRKYGSVQLAEQAVSAQKMAAFEGQLKQAAYASGNNIAIQKANVLSAQVRQQSIPLLTQLATAKTNRDMQLWMFQRLGQATQGQGFLPSDSPPAMSLEDYGNRIVTAMPDGRRILARNGKSAEELRNRLPEMDAADKALNDLRLLHDKKTFAAALPGTDENDYFEKTRGLLAMSLTKGLVGRVSQGEIDQVTKAIGGNLNQFRHKGALNPVFNFMREQRHALLRQHGGLRGELTEPQPETPYVRK